MLPLAAVAAIRVLARRAAAAARRPQRSSRPPTPGAPPAGNPGAMGVPEVPTGMGGLPVLPGEDPYDLDRYGQTTDPNDWQLWWQFNRDRFLRFSGINTGGAYTGSDGVYLGRGQVSRETIGGRASDALIDTVLSDALQKGIQKGCTNRFSQSASSRCPRSVASTSALHHDPLVPRQRHAGDAPDRGLPPRSDGRRTERRAPARHRPQHEGGLRGHHARGQADDGAGLWTSAPSPPTASA